MVLDLTPSWVLGIDWTGAATRRRADAERFSLRHPIGRGGFGEVWRAVSKEDGEEVAIKVLTPELARAPAFHAAFRREVRAVSRLHDPRILRLLDVGALGPEAEAATDGRLVAGSPFLAMELLSGGSLAEHLADPSFDRSFDRVHRIVRSLLGALGHAHARGVLHLDVKPENLLRRGSGPTLEVGYVLTDFGIAWALGEEQPIGEGTPEYAPPEQLSRTGVGVGRSADLYAVGCIAFELLTGQRPFAGKDAVMRSFDAPPRLVPAVEVPQGTEAWVHSMLDSQPARRPQNASDAARSWCALGQASTEIRASGAPHSVGSRVAPIAFGLGLWSLSEPPFVGRQDALEWLAAQTQSAWRESAGTVLEVLGPPGSGRRRLVQEHCARLDEAGVALVVDATRGHSIRASVRRALDAQGMSASRVEAHLGLRLVGTRGDTRTSALAAWLTHGGDDVAALRMLSEFKPLVLVLDAAPAGLGRLADRPVAILRTRTAVLAASTAIPEASTALPEARTAMPTSRTAPTPVPGLRHACIALGPLEPEARSELLRDVLRLGPEPIRALDAIPLVGDLVQRLLAWAQSGRLARRTGRIEWDPTHAAPVVGDDLAARIHGFSLRSNEGEMRAFEVAALLCACSGRPAELDLWVRAAHLARTAPSLGSLDRLVTEGLGQTTPNTLEFATGVLAAFRARAAPRVQAIHAAIARALEACGVSSDGQRGERGHGHVRRRHTRLARHQLAAGQPGRARTHFVLAAEQRIRALDPAGAQALLEEAAVVAADEADEWSIRVALVASAIARSRGDRDGARREAQRAHRLARDSDLYGEATRQRARVERWAGAPEVALRLLLELEGRLPDGVDRATLKLDQARVLLELGALERAHGILEALCTEPLGVEQPLLTLLRARVRRLQGDAQAGLRVLETVQATPSNGRDVATRAALQHEVGEMRVELGEFDSAAAAFRSALETLTLLGADSAPDAELSLGLALGRAGELQPAFAHVTGALGAWRQRADDRADVWSIALAWLAALGDAWPACAHALSVTRSSRDARWRSLLDQTEALGRAAERVEIVAACAALRGEG